MKPLDGIKILDLSRYLPGPFCTQMLADYGAEVIKVEDRGGELGRHLPPYLGGNSSRFYSVNRNKKSLTIDLKKQAGKEVFKRLAGECDVVVDQFRPGVMDKLGLGYEVLRQINPRLIYCAITGYGLNGPLRDTAGHDLNYLSLAGLTELTGSQGGPPVISGSQLADIAGGSLYSVIAILLALASRERTGQGQLCDVAMMDGSISLLTYALGEWSGTGKKPKRGGETLNGGYACYQIYQTKDQRYLSLGAVEDKFWAAFCKRLGREDYISYQWAQPRQEEIIKEIQTIISEKTYAEWVDFFTNDDFCLTPVLDLEEMTAHPQVKAREMIHILPDFAQSGHNMVLTGVPVKLSSTPGEAVFDFAAYGQHNQEILERLGYSEEDLRKLQEDQVI